MEKKKDIQLLGVTSVNTHTRSSSDAYVWKAKVRCANHGVKEKKILKKKKSGKRRSRERRRRKKKRVTVPSSFAVPSHTIPFHLFSFFFFFGVIASPFSFPSPSLSVVSDQCSGYRL